MSFERQLPVNLRIEDYLKHDFDLFVSDVERLVKLNPDGDVIDWNVEFSDVGVFRDLYNGAGLIVDTFISQDAARETYEASYRAMLFAYQTMLGVHGTEAALGPDLISHARQVLARGNDPYGAFREEVLGYLNDNPHVCAFINEFSMALHDSQYEAPTVELSAGLMFMLCERRLGEHHTRMNVQAIVGDMPS